MRLGERLSGLGREVDIFAFRCFWAIWADFKFRFGKLAFSLLEGLKCEFWVFFCKGNRHYGRSCGTGLIL